MKGKTQFLFLALLITFSINLYSNQQSDDQIFKQANELKQKAKLDLKKWETVKGNKLIISSLKKLYEAQKLLYTVSKKNEDKADIDLRNLNNLIFWTKKSKTVIDQDASKPVAKSKEPTPDTTEELISPPVRPKRESDSQELLFANVEIPSSDSSEIRSALQSAIQFGNLNQESLYESEFRLQDIISSYPESKSASLAKDLASSLVSKIETQKENHSKVKTEVQENINNFDVLAKKRKYPELLYEIEDMLKSNNNKGKKFVYVLKELKQECVYLNKALKILEEAFKNKLIKKTYANEIGIKKNGQIVGISQKGITLKVSGMGNFTLSWSKVKNEQLSLLLSMLKDKKNLPIEVPLSIYILGNSIQSFEIFYNSTFQTPTLMADNYHFFVQMLYDYKNNMTVIIDEKIEKAKASFDRGNTSLAINKMTRLMSSINKNKYLNQEVEKIQKVLKEEFKK